MIDLQNHTVASDGDLTPEQLVDLAVEKELTVIAITDHDSTDSVKKAVEYSNGKKIEIISGVEISCDDPLFDNIKIDILGLFVDVNNEKLVKMLKHINNVRNDHKKKIIEKLKELGYEINYEDVKKTVKGAFGKPHIAKYLIKKYPHKFSSVHDVFEKLIGKGKKAFLKISGRVSIKDVLVIIKEAGGISILAHPGIYPRGDSVKLIDYFIGVGGDGIETYYPYHIICPELNLDEKGNQEMIEFYRNIVISKKILESGGNDHHDKYRPTMGAVDIPETILEKLKEKIKH